MTLFEYLSVAISEILSLCAAQLFTNLRSVFDPSRRYWVHAVCVQAFVAIGSSVLIFAGLTCTRFQVSAL